MLDLALMIKSIRVEQVEKISKILQRQNYKNINKFIRVQQDSLAV